MLPLQSVAHTRGQRWFARPLEAELEQSRVALTPEIKSMTLTSLAHFHHMDKATVNSSLWEELSKLTLLCRPQNSF